MRPYARRTAGVPLFMHFDRETLDFTFEYEADLSITAPTELFAPEARYTNGFQVCGYLSRCDILVPANQH